MGTDSPELFARWIVEQMPRGRDLRESGVIQRELTARRQMR